jgi:hypothetical protein
MTEREEVFSQMGKERPGEDDHDGREIERVIKNKQKERARYTKKGPYNRPLL